MLNLKYNLTSGYLYTWLKLPELVEREDFQEAIKDPVIVHFTTGKPWVRWFNRTDTHPYASTFYKYQRMTIWNGFPIEDRRPKTMRLKHFIANMLRILKLKSPIPRVYIEIPPID